MNYSRIYLALASIVLAASQSLASSTCCDNAYAYGKTHFSQRPQGNFYPVIMMATADKTHIDTDKHYHVFSLTFGYKQNYDEHYQASYFLTEFETATVGKNNDPVDIRATDLVLAGGAYDSAASFKSFEGSFTAKPQVSDFIADFDFFAGFDQWAKGTWLRIHVPVVRSQWNFCLRDAISDPGTQPYPDGFIGIRGTDVYPPFNNIKDTLSATTALGTPIEAGRVRGACARWGVSDVHFELGWDFARNERGNVGAALIAAARTGLPKPCSSDNKYLFAPSIGAQRSWQLGGALRGQYQLFDDSKIKVTFYGDARVSHLFVGQVKRLLGLKAGNTTAFNHALILYPYDANAVRLSNPSVPAANQLVVEPAVNILLRTCKVSAGAMGEFTGMLVGTHKNWDGGVGYNFWGRTCEHVCPCDKSIASETWAGPASYFTIKGDTYLNPAAASYAYGKDDSNIAKTGTRFVDSVVANVKAHSFTDGDIDTKIASHPATYSNTIFGYIDYRFDTTCKPYVAVGGHMEMGCGNTALNTWGIYFKGGLTF